MEGYSTGRMPQAWRRRHAVAIIGAAACLGLVLTGAILSSGMARPGPPSAAVHAGQRLPVINATLGAASGPFILLAGDSHAALASRMLLCRQPTINAGVGGAGTKVYLGVARELRMRHRPSAIVLTLGTNDMLAKNRPSTSANLARLSRGAASVMDELAAVTDRLVVTAIPPLGHRLLSKFDGVAMTELSASMRAHCMRLPNCAFADPFATLRDTTFALARPGAMSDDLHLADYEAAYRRLEPLLCPAVKIPTADAG